MPSICRHKGTVRNRPNGHFCTEHFHCGASSFCNSGEKACRSKKGIDATCSESAQCQSGRCSSDGKCKEKAALCESSDNTDCTECNADSECAPTNGKAIFCENVLLQKRTCRLEKSENNRSPGDYCQDNEHGLCDSNRCVDYECKALSTNCVKHSNQGCGESQKCVRGDEDCENGKCVFESLGLSYCRKKDSATGRNVGDWCNAEADDGGDGQCASGRCDNWACKNKHATCVWRDRGGGLQGGGDCVPCQDDGDCSSGYCRNEEKLCRKKNTTTGRGEGEWCNMDANGGDGQCASGRCEDWTCRAKGKTCEFADKAANCSPKEEFSCRTDKNGDCKDEQGREVVCEEDLALGNACRLSTNVDKRPKDHYCNLNKHELCLTGWCDGYTCREKKQSCTKVNESDCDDSQKCDVFGDGTECQSGYCRSGVCRKKNEVENDSEKRDENEWCNYEYGEGKGREQCKTDRCSINWTCEKKLETCRGRDREGGIFDSEGESAGDCSTCENDADCDSSFCRTQEKLCRRKGDSTFKRPVNEWCDKEAENGGDDQCSSGRCDDWTCKAKKESCTSVNARDDCDEEKVCVDAGDCSSGNCVYDAAKVASVCRKADATLTRGEDEWCTDNVQCSTGRCRDHTCVPKKETCSGDKDACANQPSEYGCTVDVDCKEGAVCGNRGVCILPQEPCTISDPASCSANAHGCGGDKECKDRCLGGICRRKDGDKRGTNEWCLSDGDCDTDRCEGVSSDGLYATNLKVCLEKGETCDEADKSRCPYDSHGCRTNTDKDCEDVNHADLPAFCEHTTGQANVCRIKNNIGNRPENKYCPYNDDNYCASKRCVNWTCRSKSPACTHPKGRPVCTEEENGCTQDANCEEGSSCMMEILRGDTHLCRKSIGTTGRGEGEYCTSDVQCLTGRCRTTLVAGRADEASLCSLPTSLTCSKADKSHCPDSKYGCREDGDCEEGSFCEHTQQQRSVCRLKTVDGELRKAGDYCTNANQCEPGEDGSAYCRNFTCVNGKSEVCLRADKSLCEEHVNGCVIDSDCKGDDSFCEIDIVQGNRCRLKASVRDRGKDTYCTNDNQCASNFCKNWECRDKGEICTKPSSECSYDENGCEVNHNCERWSEQPNPNNPEQKVVKCLDKTCRYDYLSQRPTGDFCEYGYQCSTFKCKDSVCKAKAPLCEKADKTLCPKEAFECEATTQCSDEGELQGKVHCEGDISTYNVCRLKREVKGREEGKYCTSDTQCKDGPCEGWTCLGKSSVCYTKEGCDASKTMCRTNSQCEKGTVGGEGDKDTKCEIPPLGAEGVCRLADGVKGREAGTYCTSNEQCDTNLCIGGICGLKPSEVCEFADKEECPDWKNGCSATRPCLQPDPPLLDEEGNPYEVFCEATFAQRSVCRYPNEMNDRPIGSYCRNVDQCKKEEGQEVYCEDFTCISPLAEGKKCSVLPGKKIDNMCESKICGFRRTEEGQEEVCCNKDKGFYHIEGRCKGIQEVDGPCWTDDDCRSGWCPTVDQSGKKVCKSKTPKEGEYCETKSTRSTLTPLNTDRGEWTKENPIDHYLGDAGNCERNDFVCHPHTKVCTKRGEDCISGWEESDYNPADAHGWREDPSLPSTCSWKNERRIWTSIVLPGPGGLKCKNRDETFATHPSPWPPLGYEERSGASLSPQMLMAF